MTVKQANQHLAALVEKAGFSHKGLAARVREIAREHRQEVGCDHTSVKRWLSGVHPQGMTVHFIAEALSRRLGEPVSLEQIGMEQARAGVPATSLGLEYPSRLVDSVLITSELFRRDMSGEPSLVSSDALPDAWDAPAVRWLVRSVGDAARAHNGGRAVTNADVQAVRATTEAFARLDYQFGGGQPRAMLMQYLAHEIAPLLHAANPASLIGREFFSAVGALVRLMAWTAYDTCKHGLAQRYFIQALRLAQASGDHALGGRILAGMSHQATFLGHYDRAATLARAAQMGAKKQATPTGVALFYAMEARALAGMRDERACLHALRQADRAFVKRNPENDPDWLRYFDEAELAAEWAHCLRDLGQPRPAEELARRSLELSESLYVRSVSFVQTVLATVYLQQGHVDQAVTSSLDAAAMVAQLRSARSHQYVRDFTGRLAPYAGTALVKEFGEQLRTILPAFADDGVPQG